MSTPIRSQGGIDEPLLYAPRWARQTLPAAPAGGTFPDRRSPRFTEAPPTAPDITQTRGLTESPPMAPGLGGPNIDRPPRPVRPFEGDVAIKDLRERLSRDPHLVPRPPIARQAIPVLPWIGRWLLVLAMAACAGFGLRLLTLSHEAGRDAGAIAGVVTPLLESLRADATAQPPRLLVESRRAFANEPLPIGVSLNSGSGEEMVTLVGLALGTQLTTGMPLGLTGWQVPARDLGKTFAHAPRDFVGFMDTAVDLRSTRDRLIDSQIVRLEWLPKQEIRQAPSPIPNKAAPNPAAEIHALAPEEIAALIRRGEDFFKAGDVPSARIALRRAAQSGNAQAALALGATFDPILLAERGVIGFAPDATQARSWYERAVGLGSAAASRRLERLAGM